MYPLSSRLRLTLAVLFALAMSAGPWAASQESGSSPLLTPAELVQQLQAGGLVIYLRHAITDRSQTDRDRTDLSRCGEQRNLSAEGRDQARALGAAIRALEIPVGRVLSSPYCRCKDTARLAFGELEVEPDLRFGMGTDREQTERLAGALRALLSRSPESGTNTVLVSHTANLKEAAGIWPKPEGASYVFRPLSDGRFRYLGTVGPEDWPNPDTGS